MADPDEAASRYGTGSGILDPILAFSPNLTLEEIKRRRAIAGALASRRRDFPKTVGEGMTYFGEALADAFETYQLGKSEKAYEAKVGPELERLRSSAGDVGPPAVAPPPAAAAPRAAVPSPAPPATVGPRAAVDPLTWEPNSGPASRAAMAQTLEKLGANRMSAEVPSGPPPQYGGGAPVMAMGGGDTVTSEGPNPPTIVNDIRPMRMAGGPAPAPTQPPAAPGGALAPVIPNDPGPMPVLPERVDRMTKPEYDAWLASQRNQHDLRFKSVYDEVARRAQAARDAAWERTKHENDVQMKEWQRKTKERDDAVRTAPETLQKLQTGAAAVTEAQAKEAHRRVFGDIPAPVAKVLEEGKEKATLSVNALEAVRDARQALPHAVFGFGADAQLMGYRAAAKLGNKDAQRTVEASQTFQSNMGPLIQQLVKGLAGKDVSKQELEFIRSIAGGNLALDRNSAERIINIAERTSNVNIKEHQDMFDTLTRSQVPEALPSLRSIYGVREPQPAAPLLSPGSTPAEAPRVFRSEAEAAAARLPRDTIVIINGRRGRIE